MKTLKEAAEEYGRSYRGLYRSLVEGKIKGVKRGGAWWIEDDEIERALAEGRIHSRRGNPHIQKKGNIPG